jgi:hypothetical protein
MNLGRERGILRWELHHSLLTQRLARVEETLAGMAEPKGARERERGWNNSPVTREDLKRSSGHRPLTQRQDGVSDGVPTWIAT